jgi:hypothetical protein
MSSELMADDGFEAKSFAFLSWLKEMGVRMNPKMELVDLRKEGRGRGVGMRFLSSTESHCCAYHLFQQLPLQTLLKTKLFSAYPAPVY